jgi:hypothetical protein
VFRALKNVRVAGERKTAHFGLAVLGRPRAVIGALSQVGYPANGRLIRDANNGCVIEPPMKKATA